MMAVLATEAKPRQLQVSRLLQEEEEGCWISSEELHTDGSSDDECSRWPRHHSHPSQSHHLLQHLSLGSTSRVPSMQGGGAASASLPPPPTASEPVVQDAPHLTETTRRLSELGVEEAAQQGQDAVEEQEDIILWRPKRGSLKLPHLEIAAVEGHKMAAVLATGAASASSSTAAGCTGSTSGGGTGSTSGTTSSISGGGDGGGTGSTSGSTSSTSGGGGDGGGTGSTRGSTSSTSGGTGCISGIDTSCSVVGDTSAVPDTMDEGGT